MQITLSRKLHEVSVLDVQMTVGRALRRPDLLSVLMRARELDDRIRARDVSEHLLQGRPLVVGRTILRRCHELGLLDLERPPASVPRTGKARGLEAAQTPAVEDLDQVFMLTPQGRRALDTKTIFIPETGRYRVWLCEDPLLETNPLLDLQPQEESRLYDDLQAGRQGGNSETEDEVETPQLLRQLEGRVLDLAHDKPEKWQIVRVGQQCITHSLEPGRTTVTWTLGPTSRASVVLSGYFNSTWLDPPSLGWERVWEYLLGDRRRDWLPAPDRVLLTEFSDRTLTDAERLNLTRALRVASPTIPGLGQFDETEVHSISVKPRTKWDAQAWALWNLEHRVDRHLGPQEYDKLLMEIAAQFSGFPVSLPPPERLAEQIATRERGTSDRVGVSRLPPAYWFLQASHDLPRSLE